MENRDLQTKHNSFWTKSEEAEIIKTLTVIINGQKAYGKNVSLSDTYDYYKMKLNGRFPAHQVLAALMVYTDTKNDIPAPSDIISIINPAKPRITEAEFVEAQKWQERNGFPIYSEAKDLIEEYKLQQAEERHKFECKDERLLEIYRGCLKKIGPNGEIPDLS